MTIKLPIILSAMIAALAVPGTFASQPDTAEAKSETPAEAAAPAAAEGKEPEAKKMMDDKMGKKKMHHGKHHKHHHKGEGAENRGMAPRDPNDRLPYDERSNNSDGAGCNGSSDSAHAGQMEVPGQKTP